MPKWVLEPKNHEVHRFCKVDNQGKLEYISYRLLNKSGLYQDELYLPFGANKPNNTYADWAAGQDKPANTLKITEDYVCSYMGQEVVVESKDPNVIALDLQRKKTAKLEEEIAKLTQENNTLQK